MNSERQSAAIAWLWRNCLPGAVLFLATAMIVVWQNSRLAVLWDISYILENAYRISLGQIPYRDFPFPYPPLTFLIQAALIKLTGRVFWHTIVYCAVVGGLGTVLTWRIVLNVMRERVRQPRVLAFLFSLLLIPLGIYSIFPHPFYDPDCTLAILICILIFQRVERKPHAIVSPLLLGMSSVVPLFIKQNAGLAFLFCVLGAMAILIVAGVWRRESVRRYVIAFAAVLLAFGVALLLIHFIAGLKNYWQWTIRYAASRRTPARREMFEIYWDKWLLAWLGLIAAGAIVWWIGRARNVWLRALSALLIAVPFIWPAIYLLRDHDASERADRLLAVWPMVLICSLVVAIVTIKRLRISLLVLTLILIGTINGAFMSQQLWGSTYAIWPLLVILLALTLTSWHEQFKMPARWTMALSILIIGPLLVSGSFYVRAHERLDYANLDDGELKRSSLAPLKGLETRGDWLPNFEELVSYSNREIPRDEGILLLPGEDLFYYTTGRTPQFPVLLFDHTVNPYSPADILNLCRERNIKWVIVKQDIQDEDEGINQEEEQITAALESDFEQVESLKNYDIYHRIDPNKKKTDEDDDDDDKP